MNGTTVKSIPASDLNSSAERCCVLPIPIVPTVSFPGSAFAAAMTSFTVFSLDSLPVTMASPKYPICETVAKSLTGS